eukprot:354075-Chlamydomonas_euryale.AAC.1
MEAVGGHDVVVLCGETGCGKTTQWLTLSVSGCNVPPLYAHKRPRHEASHPPSPFPPFPFSPFPPSPPSSFLPFPLSPFPPFSLSPFPPPPFHARPTPPTLPSKHAPHLLPRSLESPPAGASVPPGGGLRLPPLPGACGRSWRHAAAPRRRSLDRCARSRGARGGGRRDGGLPDPARPRGRGGNGAQVHDGRHPAARAAGGTCGL